MTLLLAFAATFPPDTRLRRVVCILADLWKQYSGHIIYNPSLFEASLGTPTRVNFLATDAACKLLRLIWHSVLGDHHCSLLLAAYILYRYHSTQIQGPRIHHRGSNTGALFRFWSLLSFESSSSLTASGQWRRRAICIEIKRTELALTFSLCTADP
jgi:hypothetical protein